MSAYLLLLSERNIAAAARNHADEFIAGMRELDAIQARTGLPFTADEKRRLAALAAFVSHGLFVADRTTTKQEEPVPA